MSPEQAEGKPVDARSDIFSFGSVFYEMLSGRRAFRGESSLAVLAAVLRETPDPLPGIAMNLQNVVSRCLQKDPNLRVQSAVELKSALETCLPLSIASSNPIKTIAVLPFNNLSGDKDNEYFSDGITEEMISALARLPGLRVTARTSAFAMRGHNLDVREIGAKLNVEHILEGSVRRFGNRVRVTAQLVNAADGYQLWSERYDREMRDVLDIQDEISHAIVETLRVRLANISPVKRHTGSPEAYSLYLRGRHYQEMHTPEGYSKARDCFERAIAADSKYALAFLGLAEFHWQNAFYGFQYPREALARAKEAAVRALEIDDALPEGHAQLGTMLGVAGCDWRAAGLAFQRALELDANSPYVLYRYANFYLWPQGRAEEATALIERALSVDPMWVLANWVLAYYIYAGRQYDRAISHLLAVIDMAPPTFYLAHCVLGLAYAQRGMQHEAVGALERACELIPGNPFTLGMLAYGLGKMGKSEEAADLIAKLRTAEQHSYVPAKSLMFAWAGLNDAQNVLACAERSLDERDPMTIMCLTHEPVLDFVRTDPRYRALLRKMNL